MELAEVSGFPVSTPSEAAAAMDGCDYINVRFQLVPEQAPPDQKEGERRSGESRGSIQPHRVELPHAVPDGGDEGSCAPPTPPLTPRSWGSTPRTSEGCITPRSEGSTTPRKARAHSFAQSSVGRTRA